MDHARHWKREGGLWPNLIMLEIKIYTTWPLVVYSKSCSYDMTHSNRYQFDLCIPCIKLIQYIALIVLFLSTVLVILLVARVILQFPGLKFPSEDFWELNYYSDNKMDQDLTQWEESGWWDKCPPHRVGGWIEDCK